MGMDVYGKKPTNETGEYFRRNVWGWHPLWGYCEDVHPELVESVRHGHSNDGDGLDAEDSERLSVALLADLADGTVDNYIVERRKHLASLERPECKYCEGTGIRSDEIGIQHGQPEKELSLEESIFLGRTHGYCNGCNGEGKTDAWETHYYLERDDIQEFAEFLADCGGFEIC